METRIQPGTMAGFGCLIPVKMTQVAGDPPGPGHITVLIFVFRGNPLKYTDPDGRESGYALDENAVFSLGHAGWFVKTDTGYAFFEVTGLPDGASPNYTVTLGGENRNGKVLSNSAISSPTPGSAEIAGKPTSAGILRSDFNTKGEMLEYLGKAGKNGGFDSYIEFNTTPEQDSVISGASESSGNKFKNYQLIGNSCGTIARDVLTTPGSGIKGRTPGGLAFIGWNNAPKGIGAMLGIANGGIASKHRIKK
jgi:hypothetical protein